jgi:hypothetical protein
MPLFVQRTDGLPQPHWQFVSWQRHLFGSHPQEQLPHAQLDFLAFFVTAFFTLDIVFLLFLYQRCLRFQKG